MDERYSRLHDIKLWSLIVYAHRILIVQYKISTGSQPARRVY